MRLSAQVSLALLFLVGSGPAWAQKIDNPAELFPAKTVAYAEFREPGRHVEEIAKLFKDSVFGNVPDSLAMLRGQGGSRNELQPLAGVGMFLSKEVINELSRVQGAAAALTGIDKEEKGMPEYVAVILPGESNLPALFMRGLLAFTSNSNASFGGPNQQRTRGTSAFEPIGECEGVQLYRTVKRTIRIQVGPDGREGPPSKPEIKQVGPACALMPNALLVGSINQVKNVIRRLKGQSNEPSLAGDAKFQETMKQLGKSSCYMYVNQAAALDVVRQAPINMAERAIFEMVSKVVNPKFVEASAATMDLENGTFRFRKLVLLNPNEKSLVLDIFPSVPLKTEMLHFAPKNAFFVAALSNGDAEKRMERILKVVDENAPVNVSNMLEPIETQLGFKIGKDIVGKIEGVAVAVCPPAGAQAAPGGPPGIPGFVVILLATDENAAKGFITDLIPKLAGAATQGAAGKPEEKDVGGQTIYSYQLPGMPLPACFGRQGATLVFGADPAFVADALAGGVKKEGLLADEKYQAAVKQSEDAVLLIAVKSLSIFPYIGQRAAAVAPGQPPPARVGPTPEDLLRLIAPLAKEEEPLTIRVIRKPDSMITEIQYGNLQAWVPKLTNIMTELYLASDRKVTTTFKSVGPAIQAPPRPREQFKKP
jgi:hypothetical protein